MNKILKFNKNKFDLENPVLGCYLNMPNELYHACAGISNTGLNLIKDNPANYIWSKNAPQDPSKTNAIDIGSAVHACLLEPEKIDQILVGPTKGRDTIKFAQFCEENQGKIVLTETEYTQVKYSVDSALAHPTIAEILGLKSHNESSMFWRDEGTLCKIRPDMDLTPSGINALVDVKVTKSIDEWRSDLTWKNPLFTLNYGHNAAFYLRGASSHYGIDYDVYSFILIQSSACIGRYPVTVFSVTRQELENYGFFDDVESNLSKYKECINSGKWDHIESFPFFEGMIEGSE